MKKLKSGIRPLAAVLLLAAMLMATVSGAGEQVQVVERLQEKYGSITTIEADFTQEFSSAMGGVQTSSGKVYMKKPGKMRWNYREPIQDEIVSDGRTIWVYQPDLNQVILRPVDEAATSIATDFLSGIGQITRDFHAEIYGESPEAWTLKLTPRSPQPNLKILLLDVDKQSLLATRTAMTDHFGNETRVSFSGIKLNHAIAGLLFDFTPPEGASIIRP